MSKFFLFCFLFVISATGFAATPDFQGLVNLSNGHQIYSIHYKAPAGRPTVILVNGLTYTTKAWDKMVASLVGRNFGILSYDAYGMGQSLEASGPIQSVIPIESQADDLALLMNHFELAQADLVGLSYGGALTLQFALKYPEKIDKLILMAPYIRPLKQQDDLIKQQVQTHHWMYPLDRRSDDELYDYYLKQNIMQTYPIYEPVLNEKPNRTEAVFHMVQGVRKFMILDQISKLPAGKIHLVLAEKDQYVPKADHEDFWKALSNAQKLSRVTVTGSEHKIPEAVPEFAAAWVREIILGNPRIGEGKVMTGDPKTGLITGPESFQIQLN
jgi:pimeloyl-ACP methyl ester carboxylesterase